MAEEILKELKYGNSKVLVEAAKRDSQGRMIDSTYATTTDLNNKLNKLQLSQGNLLYARVNGIDLGAVYDTQAQANTIVARDAQGHVIGATPTDPTHLTTKSYVDSAVGSVSTIRFSIVDELPSTGESNIIYLVPNTTSSEENTYDEYIWVNNDFEIIGSTAVDLSNYAKLDSDNIFTGVQYFNNTNGILIDGFKLNNAFLTNWQTEINKIGGIETDITSIESDVNSLTTKVSTNTTNISTNTSDIESINSEITTIQGDITSIESNVGEIENKVTSLRNDVTALGTNVGANTQNINTINGEIDGINDDITSLTTNITNTQQAVLKLNNQVETNTSDITQVKQDLDNKLDKTTTAGAYVNDGDSVVNIPVNNTPTANAIPRYNGAGTLRSSSVDWNIASDNTVVNKSIYESNFKDTYDLKVIPTIDLSGSGFDFNDLFGSNIGDNITNTLSGSTYEPIIKQLMQVIGNCKQFRLRGTYSNGGQGTSKIDVLFSSNSTYGFNSLQTPYIFEGTILNNNGILGSLNFKMRIDCKDEEPISLKYQTLLYSENYIPFIQLSSEQGTLSSEDFEKIKLLPQNILAAISGQLLYFTGGVQILNVITYSSVVSFSNTNMIYSLIINIPTKEYLFRETYENRMLLTSQNWLYLEGNDTPQAGIAFKTINNQLVFGHENLQLQETLVSGTNIKTINNQSLLGSGNIDVSSEIPTITISSLSGTLSDSDYEKLVNSDMAKFVSPLGTYTAFKYTLPNQQNNLYYYVYQTNESGTTCYSMIVTNGTTKTYVANSYTVGGSGGSGNFTPETIAIENVQSFGYTQIGTFNTADFSKLKVGVPINLNIENEVYGCLVVEFDQSVDAFFVFSPSNGYTWVLANTGDCMGNKNYLLPGTENTFEIIQHFEGGLTVGATTQSQLTINNNGALSITDDNGTVGLNGQGLMYRAGGSTRVLKMPTDSVSANTEIVSKGYLDSQNYLKATNTTGALLTISNDKYIALKSNVASGGGFVVANKTNNLPGFEVLDENDNVVFDAKSKQGVVNIGTSTARMLFGSGITPENKVVKFFTGDNNNILTFGLGGDRLSVDFNGRVLFNVQTTTVSQDFNSGVQSGEIAGRLDTGLTDEHIIITSMYDTTNQVEFMNPYYDGTKWYATAICVAQSIGGTSNVQIKYIRLP